MDDELSNLRAVHHRIAVESKDEAYYRPSQITGIMLFGSEFLIATLNSFRNVNKTHIAAS
jgi:hypothetical protein